MPARDDRRYEHSTAIGKPSESSIKHQTSPSQHGGIPDSPTMVPRAPEISSATPGPARLGRRLPERHHPPPTATAMPPAERPARHARFPASPRANAGMNAPRASHMREGLQLLASDRASRQSPSSPLTLMGPPCCSIILKESPAGPPSRLGQPPPPAARILRSPSGGSHRGSRLSEGGGDGPASTLSFLFPQNPFSRLPAKRIPLDRRMRARSCRRIYPADRPDSALIHPTAAPRPAAPAPLA